MNYGWTILIWVAIGLYVFSFLDKVDKKPKRKRRSKKKKKLIGTKIFSVAKNRLFSVLKFMIIYIPLYGLFRNL